MKRLAATLAGSVLGGALCGCLVVLAVAVIDEQIRRQESP